MQRKPPDNWTASHLNKLNCLTLRQIVGSFSAPITEEHAWAIVFEITKTLDICLANPSVAHRLFIVNNLSHVFIHEDGHVQEETFIVDNNEGKICIYNFTNFLEELDKSIPEINSRTAFPGQKFVCKFHFNF